MVAFRCTTGCHPRQLIWQSNLVTFGYICNFKDLEENQKEPRKSLEDNWNLENNKKLED